jgi:hypothetical protein
MTCHQLHREGALDARPQGRISVAGQPVHDSLAFYDRREGLHFAATALTIPVLHDRARVVTVSQDPRQGICYECHAPRQPEAGTLAAANGWGRQVGSGDDRTPIGVHEGLSCIACHMGHNQNTRASCKNCHPQMSHCGLDVEKMDTTYASDASPHNIHWVRCTDCHGAVEAVTVARLRIRGVHDKKTSQDASVVLAGRASVRENRISLSTLLNNRQIGILDGEQLRQIGPIGPR